MKNEDITRLHLPCIQHRKQSIAKNLIIRLFIPHFKADMKSYLTMKKLLNIFMSLVILKKCTIKYVPSFYVCNLTLIAKYILRLCNILITPAKITEG
jgi:hypothetical protein